ncbi:hypothetical protein OIDMADRAFT_24968 [Oidiodendron maius Zn]|uniref:Uncharacterized protein n=1 Tax=Oidiodendron maius (strain Zn) TaxID=913774 RepID=A0A0C3HEN2_OIDMZ|nr:hypothetical protein OIDMADRAFT_24968 [Oidiodendron maius Zn]
MVRIKYTTDAAAKAGRLRASQAEDRQKSDKDTGNSDASNLNQPQRNSVVTTNTKPQANSVITNNTQPQGNEIVTTNIQAKSSDRPVATQDEQGRIEVLVSLDTIKKNPKLAELFAMKEMRKVFWGKAFSPAIKLTHNIRAALITSRGTILKICGQCKIGKKGIFTETSTDNDIFTAAALKRIHETQESITQKMADLGEIYPPVAETVDEESKITEETETVEQNEDSALSIETNHQDAPRRKRAKRTHVS